MTIVQLWRRKNAAAIHRCHVISEHRTDFFFPFAKPCVSFSQEFYDEWPIRLGEAEPYKGPKTPDGRVRILIFLFMNLNFDIEVVHVTNMFFSFYLGSQLL